MTTFLILVVIFGIMWYGWVIVFGLTKIVIAFILDIIILLNSIFPGFGFLMMGLAGGLAWHYFM